MMLYQPEETELAIRTSASRMLLVGTAQIAAKTTRDSQGVAVVTLKKNQTIASVVPADTLELANPHRYRVRSLPATGALIRAEDEGEQMKPAVMAGGGELSFANESGTPCSAPVLRTGAPLRRNLLRKLPAAFPKSPSREKVTPKRPQSFRSYKL